MAKKSIESLYDVLFNMRKVMEDLVQDATGLVNDVNDYGGEMNRVIKEQMQKYFIPAIQNLTKDENTPGSIIGIIRFMDSLPLAMTRVEPQVEQVAPVEQPNANIDMPEASEEGIPEGTSYENPVPGAAPEAPATPVEEVAAEQPITESKIKESENICPVCGKDPCECEELEESKKATDICFGTALAKKKNQLNKITSNTDLIAFVKEVCGPLANDAEQEAYLNKMIDTIKRSAFSRALMFVYNIILKGEGQGVIKESITKYSVIRKSNMGSPLGEEIANLEDQEVALFNTEEEANERCDLLNKGVLPEEKDLFGTEYIVEKKEICEEC